MKAKLIESDDDEVLHPTPTQSKIKPSKPGRHRVKKQVSKTFVDEEGFMVTKKVMESCSETDEEECEEATKTKQNIVKESQKENTKSNTIPPTGKIKNSVPQNKQASIMSFFQKK